jgi:hypothetical protein
MLLLPSSHALPSQKQNNFRKGKTEIKQHPWQQKRQVPKVSKSFISMVNKGNG